MKSILFLPLNTNHVSIFKNLLPHLHGDYTFVCHDRVSEAKQYHTENLLNKLNLSFEHFPQIIDRSSTDSIFVKINKFYQVERGVKHLLDKVNPKIIVMAIDNDPINQIFICEAKKRSIKTILMQEALFRPLEYTMRKTYRSDYYYKILRNLGIYLNYIPLGSGGCDKILLGGQRAKDILIKRGIPQEKLVITGLPKYDEIVKALSNQTPKNQITKNSFLFIASTLVVYNKENTDFLKILSEIAEKNKIELIVKLHPRTEHEPNDIYQIIGKSESQYFKILKGGDDTTTLLQKVSGIITVSSTVILDALMMNKKCVVVDYLAGESQLQYDVYDAVFQISQKEDIETVLNQAMENDKDLSNKTRLLEAELYKLDGLASKRAAEFIKNYYQN